MKWYKFDIGEFSEEEYEKWYSLMSQDKKSRVDRFLNADDKKRTVAGEMLARKAVSEWCDVLCDTIAFKTDEHGKPYAENLNVQFNISHSGNIVVCAVSNNPVGIDVEEIRPIDLKIAKRICSDDELKYIFDGKEPAFSVTTNKKTLTRFFEIWTAKEAVGKLTGHGLANISKPLNKEVERHITENYVISIAV